MARTGARVGQYEAECVVCGRSFWSASKSAKYCSFRCKKAMDNKRYHENKRYKNPNMSRPQKRKDSYLPVREVPGRGLDTW